MMEKNNKIFEVKDIKENILELHFFQGQSDYLEENNIKEDERKNAVKAKIAEFFNMKNVCFLFGAGTSCPAIPNMAGLYAKVEKALKGKYMGKRFDKIAKACDNKLEEILSVLYSGRAYYQGFGDGYKYREEKCSDLIKFIEEIIFKSINIDFAKGKAPEVLEIYKSFYQKIAFRNKDLSRICVFTTNNDLFNERAMDNLNIHYVNGFSGGIKKHFNPAMFNYTFSKRMDVSIDKYEPVENMVYFYKIHGSVNWIDDDKDDSNFFSIMENANPQWSKDKNTLIYPTPTKQNKSLGAPYVDLFREFQHRLLEPNIVLFVMGYGFNDEHVNDVIYRALATNTTFNLVVIDHIAEDKPICKIDDKRIFRLWGEVENPDSKKDNIQMHYFDYTVREWMPNLNAFAQEEKIVKDFVKGLKEISKKV